MLYWIRLWLIGSLKWFLVASWNDVNFLVSDASTCFLLAFLLDSSKSVWIASSISPSLILKKWWLEILFCNIRSFKMILFATWNDGCCVICHRIWKSTCEWCIIFTNHITLKMNLFIWHISTFMTVKLVWHVTDIAFFVYFEFVSTSSAWFIFHVIVFVRFNLKYVKIRSA